MVSTLELIINILAENRKGLLNAFDSRGTRGFPLSIRHEAPTVTLRCVRPGTSRPWDDVDLEAARAAGGIRLGLGEFDKAPVSGTWPLLYNGDDDDTDALGFDISAADLKTALNANASIAADGGIATVTLSGRTYRCTFTTVGAKADFTTPDENDLLPLSTVTISRVRTGSESRHEVVTITVKRNAYAFQDVWTASAAADATVTTSVPGGVGASEVQVITLTPGTYGGTYSVQLALPIEATVAIVGNTVANPTVIEATGHGLASGDLITIPANNGSTPSLVGTHEVTVIDVDHVSIPLNVTVGGTGGTFSKNTIGALTLSGSASADEILAVLLTHPEAMRDDLAGIAVTGSIGGPFSVSFQHHFANLDLAEMVATNINLLAPLSVTGELDLNNDAMAAAFDAAGTTTITLTAELELEFPGQKPSKPYQDTGTIRKDVIDLQTTRPAPTSSYPLPGFLILYRPDITDTSGGAANCLDGIVTVGLITGKCLIINVVGAPRVWELVAGTDAEDVAGGIVRPDDYDAGTNAFVWKSIL